MKEYIKLLEQLVDLLEIYLTTDKLISETIEKIRDKQQETGVVVRQLTYTGNKLAIERTLAKRNVIGVKELPDYTILEEFINK